MRVGSAPYPQSSDQFLDFFIVAFFAALVDAFFAALTFSSVEHN